MCCFVEHVHRNGNGNGNGKWEIDSSAFCGYTKSKSMPNAECRMPNVECGAKDFNLPAGLMCFGFPVGGLL